MEKIIYLKYGELTLKKKNRDDFSTLLFSNLKNALLDFKDLYFIKNYDSVIIKNINSYKIDDLVSIIEKIPGFTNLSIAYVIPKDIELLKQEINTLVENKNITFKVISKRKDKSFHINSDEINRIIASSILNSKNNLKVDIHNPDLKINIEILQKDIIFYFNKINCANGLPIGIEGKVLLLLSGGIDSCVASHLLMKRGLHVDFLTFITPPHTSNKALEKVIELANIVTLNKRLEKYKLFVCNFTKVQDELTHISKENYRITMLRRSFFRIATKIAKKYGYDAIATGESLGQVASQTIDSMNVISNVTDLLILRPLLAMDKNEIINLAKKINTYETSILPYSDSCSLFAPKNPITKPKLFVVEELEKKLELLYSIEELVYNNTIKDIENDY